MATFPDVSCWLLEGDYPEGLQSLNLPHHPLPLWAVDRGAAEISIPTYVNNPALTLPHEGYACTPPPSENGPRPQHSASPQGIAGGTARQARLYQGAPANQAPDAEDLVSRFDQVLNQLLHNQEVAERRQENTEAQLAFLVDELRRMSRGRHGERSSVRRADVRPPPFSPLADPLEGDDIPGRKDSTGNYVRRCVRKHVALAFGFSPTGAVPISPSEQFKNHVLSNVNHGGLVQKPFMYDWQSPPSSLYNLCIEGAFCVDFWGSVESGVYDLDRIPPKYQRRRPFVKTLRTYLSYIKQMIRLASHNRTQQAAFRARSTKNSRKTTNPMPTMT
ncbi:hypothetical protein LXA43DRAFT_1064047 [Ganoderma leucocontextum]|nr:hypothetical protein LXA43DRAFT_1064047 [Ganoderma leucocontextum]